jgi:hypothetical protein
MAQSSSSEVPQARVRYVQAAAASAGVQFDEEQLFHSPSSWYVFVHHE